MLDSLWEYVPALARWRWLLVAGVVLAALTVVLQLMEIWKRLPGRTFIGLSVLSLLVVQFLAFHDVRVERDGAQIELDHLRQQLSARENGSHAAGPNKYVCQARLSPFRNVGKHGLLVEFGVRHEQTHGFYGGVGPSNPCSHVERWFAGPLRTDRQEPLGEVRTMSKTTRRDTEYLESFQSPSLTAHESRYFYFEADQPSKLVAVVFVEDGFAADDPVRIDQLSRDVGECPRPP